MAKKLIIFDFDGTLMNTNDVIIDSLNDAAKKYLNRDITESEFEAILGKPIIAQMAALSTEHCDEMVEHYRIIYRASEDGKVFPFEGIISLLDQLKAKGITCAILTNKGRRGLNKSLIEHDMTKYFDYSITANDIEKTKPDPYGIYLICDELGFKPEETIMVGDSAHDIEAGKNAGITTILVSWTILNIETLKLLSPDGIIDTPDDLLRYI